MRHDGILSGYASLDWLRLKPDLITFSSLISGLAWTGTLGLVRHVPATRLCHAGGAFEKGLQWQRALAVLCVPRLRTMVTGCQCFANTSGAFLLRSSVGLTSPTARRVRTALRQRAKSPPQSQDLVCSARRFGQTSSCATQPSVPRARAANKVYD